MDIIGIDRVDFTGRDGERVQGLRLYFTDPSEEVSVGVACDTLFLSAAKLDKYGLSSADFSVPGSFAIEYNKHGGIKSISVD